MPHQGFMSISLKTPIGARFEDNSTKTYLSAGDPLATLAMNTPPSTFEYLELRWRNSSAIAGVSVSIDMPVVGKNDVR